MSQCILGSRIHDVYTTKTELIKTEIASQQAVCSTADIWSTPKRSYMRVTCHWVDPQMLSCRSSALARRRFKGAHTYDRIANYRVLYVNDEFNLDETKLLL